MRLKVERHEYQSRYSALEEGIHKRLHLKGDKYRDFLFGSYPRILKTIFLLISLIWCVHSQEESTPVNLLKLKNIVIEDYHGHMDARTAELLENVEKLAFHNCNFTTVNENYLHPLKNLQKLVVSNCHFDRVKNDISSCCEKLREIEMLDSNFGTVGEEECKKTAGMKPLERLTFHKGDIPVLKPNSLTGSNLKKIEIHHSNLASIEDGAFNGMEKLEILNLKHNKIKSIPTASLAAVETLKELNLEGNLLEKVTTADIPSLPNLEKLNLGHNPVKEINLKGLKEKLPNIKQVDVSGIEIVPSDAEGIPLFKQQIV